MFSRIRSPLAFVILAATSAVAIAGCSECDGEMSDMMAPSQVGTPAPVPVMRAWSADVSNQARKNMAQSYDADVASYWAVYGLPTLARGAEIREADGVPSPNGNFDPVMRALDTKRLIEACRAGTVSELLCASPSPTAADVVSVIRSSTSLDPSYRTRMLKELVTEAFDAGQLAAMAPATSKEALVLPSVQSPVCDAGPGGANVLTWDKVAGSKELAGGKNDGMCVTKAVGLCTQRLGLRNNEVTLEAWQELSDQLGALPQGGAQISSMKSYFEDRGYAFTEAWDGPLESACTEANSALARGCDVFLWYDSGETQSHIEMVEDIDTQYQPGYQCVATTNSWGERATAKINRGRYSEKSDRVRYPDFRETSGSTLYYACPKK
ncbi:MAG: hypothetical protein U0270_16165 [Labilithrix sp.]